MNGSENNSAKAIEIFFAADDGFTQHLAVAAASLLHNAAEKDIINIHILTNGLNNDNINKIKSLVSIKPCTIEFITVDENQFSNYHSPDYINSTTTFFRYLLPQIRPELDKALYLDSDIVVTKSLHDLFNIDLEDCYLGAVEDVHTPCGANKLKFGFTFDNFYFNAGVLLLNCKKMREDNIVEKLFQQTEILSTRCYVGADQDVLNIVCKKRKLLDVKYNVLTAVFDKEINTRYSDKTLNDAIQDPVIIHYSDRQKPWHIKTFPSGIYDYIYHRYLRLTPYYKRSFQYRLLFQNLFFSRYLRSIKQNMVVILLKDFIKFIIQLVLIFAAFPAIAIIEFFLFKEKTQLNVQAAYKRKKRFLFLFINLIPVKRIRKIYLKRYNKS